MSELRRDPIQGRWVIIAATRSRRPQDYQPATYQRTTGGFCPFCPGHESRTPGEILAVGRPPGAPANGPGWRVRVVPNKYPALTIEGDLEPRGVGPYDSLRGVGAHEVVICSPDHEAALSVMQPDHLTEVLAVFQERQRDLHRDRRLKYVQVFKNHGAAAGATLAHPHAQIIATPVIPNLVARELGLARRHFGLKERCLFCDVLAEEVSRGDRVVLQDEHFVVFAPYASRFPFELMILPRRHGPRFQEATPFELAALARSLREAARRLSRILDDPPYNLVLHSAPNTDAFYVRPDAWQTLAWDYHWHLLLLPRLTRAAGFESGTGLYINPTAPEEAARFLREVEGE